LHRSFVTFTRRIVIRVPAFESNPARAREFVPAKFVFRSCSQPVTDYGNGIYRDIEIRIGHDMQQRSQPGVNTASPNELKASDSVTMLWPCGPSIKGKQGQGVYVYMHARRCHAHQLGTGSECSTCQSAD
jgi:hypothetical protein